jgi:NADH-quinone oxidoreductase subunit J
LPGLGIGGLLIGELFLAVAMKWNFATHAIPGETLPKGVTNTAALGHILYTDYIFYFQASGLILLVAMIGAIVLTLRHKPGVRRQKAWTQISRGPADSMSVVDVKPGEGVQ